MPRSIRRILLVLPPSPGRSAAVERSLALARTLGADLYGVAGPASAHGAPGRDASRPEDPLDRLAHTLRADGVTRVELIRDPTDLRPERVADLVSRLEIDLVVKDLGGPPGLGTRPLPSFDRELIRSCSVPVWLAAPVPNATALPRRIVAAVDPVHAAHGAGPLNERILKTARRVTALAHGRLRVLSAFEGLLPGVVSPDPMGLAAGSGNDERYEQLRMEFRIALHALLRGHQLPADAGLVVYGPPPTTLVEALDAYRPELLVVGTLQRRGLKRLILGNTAERLVTDAPWDVLVVPAALAPEKRSIPIAREAA